MKRIISVTAITLCSAFVLAGCSGLHVTQPDYDNLPGSGQKPIGPGIFDAKSKNYDDGYVIYSNNPDQPALYNNAAKKKAEQEKVEQQKASAGNGSGYTPSASEEAQFKQFQEFQAFQHYKEFEGLPDNAEQRKKFEQWKQWDQYKKWKKQNEG